MTVVSVDGTDCYDLLCQLMGQIVMTVVVSVDRTDCYDCCCVS